MKLEISSKRKREIFEKVLVDFSFIGFHKDLDKALAMFIDEKMTYENKKTFNDYSIMDFCKWVTEKKLSNT